MEVLEVCESLLDELIGEFVVEPAQDIRVQLIGWFEVLGNQY